MALKPLPQLRMHQFASGVLCRCAAWVLLAVVLVAIVGVPMPAKTRQLGDEPYPCQGCACGCSSAAHCWDRCCCHSDVEKLAWASEHNVIPPVFLVERVAKQQAASVAIAGVTKSCCVSHQACCSAKQTVVETSETQDADAVAVMTIVRLEDAAQCRGMQLVWTLLSSMVIGLAQPRNVRPEPLLICWLRVTSDRATSLVAAIDPPVPWLSVSLSTFC